jgi:septation ring formation regulator EzrA
MFNINFFYVVLIFFLLFIFIQIYFYGNILKKNEEKITNMESFKNSLSNLNTQNEYILDDTSIKIILEDYNKLKNSL